MAARQGLDDRIEFAPAEFIGDLVRKFRQKRQVVLAINHQRLLLPARKLVKERHRADREPDFA